jgi:hypothetical protein
LRYGGLNKSHPSLKKANRESLQIITIFNCQRTFILPIIDGIKVLAGYCSCTTRPKALLYRTTQARDADMTLCIGFGANDMRRDTAGTGGISRIERRKGNTVEEGNIYIVVGHLLPATHRRNFQGSSRYFQRSELGLSPAWELAHLWAPRFGDEAAAGIMWAPQELNQTFQNHVVEPWITSLRDAAPPSSVEITAIAVSWNNDLLASQFNWSGYMGAEFLKEVSYEVNRCPSGMLGPHSGVRLLGSSVSMSLNTPRPGILPRVVRLETETLQGGTATVCL